jgi:hypothetical protein
MAVKPGVATSTISLKTCSAEQPSTGIRSILSRARCMTSVVTEGATRRVGKARR